MASNLIVQQMRVRRAIVSIEWLIFIGGVLLGLLIPYFLRHLGMDHVEDFVSDLVPEAVGIFFTVVFINRMSARREARFVCGQLVRRAHSRHNNTALTAIEELRVLGQLEHGALSGIELRGSNWESANLYEADLRHSDLRRVRLDGADLVFANLTGAKVSQEQLASTDSMYRAIMPWGKRYDGRYRLLGDYHFAERQGVNPESQIGRAHV